MKPEYKIGDRIKFRRYYPKYFPRAFRSLKYYRSGNLVTDIWNEGKRWYVSVRGCGDFMFPAGEWRKV